MDPKYRTLSPDFIVREVIKNHLWYKYFAREKNNELTTYIFTRLKIKRNG
jgi:hypothetical protein